MPAEPKKILIKNNTSKTCESSTYICPNCIKFENQTLSKLKEWLKEKNQPI